MTGATPHSTNNNKFNILKDFSRISEVRTCIQIRLIPFSSTNDHFPRAYIFANRRYSSPFPPPSAAALKDYFVLENNVFRGVWANRFHSSARSEIVFKRFFFSKGGVKSVHTSILVSLSLCG